MIKVFCDICKREISGTVEGLSYFNSTIAFNRYYKLLSALLPGCKPKAPCGVEQVCKSCYKELSTLIDRIEDSVVDLYKTSLAEQIKILKADKAKEVLLEQEREWLRVRNSSSTSSQQEKD